MAMKGSFAVVLLLALASSAAAFNITRILNQFSDFSAFNSLLSQTKLADDINRRQTITVLAVANDAMGAISSQPSDVQRDILAVHVVLDYYDTDKLSAMKNGSAMLTTMFQSTGQATDRMGFIKYTKRAGGSMMFGSAEPSAPPATSQLVKSVLSRPYNISVLQVSSAIVPPGIGAMTNTTSTPAPTPAKSKGPRKMAAPVPAPGPSDDVAAADAPADAPTPAADSPNSDGPAPAPAADSPDADGPAAADAPAHDAADAEKGAAADRMVAFGSVGIMAVLTTIVSL